LQIFIEVALAAGTRHFSPTVVKVIKGPRSILGLPCNVVIATAMAERLLTLRVKTNASGHHNWVDDPSPIPALKIRSGRPGALKTSSWSAAQEILGAYAR
jgi:hypothetical protein